MARKTSNSAEYFSHYVKHGQLLFILQSRWGNDGYAFWFKLLEILTAAEGHFIDLKLAPNVEYFRAVMAVEDPIRVEILDMLANLRRIDQDLYKDHKIIWCQDLVDGLAELYRRRNHPPPEKPCIPQGKTDAKTPLESAIPVGNTSGGDVSEAEITIGSKGSKGREGQPNPPPSASPPPEDQIPKNGDALADLRKVNPSLTLSASESDRLHELGSREPWRVIVAAYGIHQHLKPGKAFRWFLDDFAQYRAKIPKPRSPPASSTPVVRTPDQEREVILTAARFNKAHRTPLTALQQAAVKHAEGEPLTDHERELLGLQTSATDAS